MEKLTFKQLLSNPAGKYSAHQSNRKLTKENLESRFSLLLSKYKLFKTKIFKLNDSFIFHIKVPSEQKTQKDLFYDVILEFINHSETSSSLNSYIIKFWSNSPAFTYTYAYVANKNNLIPSWVKGKSGRKALWKKPKKRNPGIMLGFEKSIHFAALYIIHKDLLKITNVIKLSQKFDKKYIKLIVPSAGEKFVEYGTKKIKHRIRLRLFINSIL